MWVLQRKKGKRWITLRNYGYSVNKKEPWRAWELTKQRLMENPLTDKKIIKLWMNKKNFRAKQVEYKKKW